MFQWHFPVPAGEARDIPGLGGIYNLAQHLQRPPKTSSEQQEELGYPVVQIMEVISDRAGKS